MWSSMYTKKTQADTKLQTFRLLDPVKYSRGPSFYLFFPQYKVKLLNTAKDVLLSFPRVI